MIQRREFYFDSLNSTQDYLREYLRSSPLKTNGLEFVWVRARCQSSGRGRLGRSWISSEGALLTSMAVSIDKPNFLSIAHLPLASFIGAVSLYESLQSVLAFNPTKLFFKWPNDLVFENPQKTSSDSSRSSLLLVNSLFKIAGIICESLGQKTLLIGWGLNVLQAPQEVNHSASLKDFLDAQEIFPKAELDVERIYKILQMKLEIAFEAWFANPVEYENKLLAKVNTVMQPLFGFEAEYRGTQKVKILGISSKGELKVQCLNSGDEFYISSGELL